MFVLDGEMNSAEYGNVSIMVLPIMFLIMKDILIVMGYMDFMMMQKDLLFLTEQF